MAIKKVMKHTTLDSSDGVHVNGSFQNHMALAKFNGEADTHAIIFTDDINDFSSALVVVVGGLERLKGLRDALSATIEMFEQAGGVH